MLAAAVFGACGPSGTPASPTIIPRTIAPASPTPAEPTPTARATGTPGAAWPAGWDDAFCAVYAEIVVAQELARDIGRALEEDDRDDAIGLAHELDATVTTVRTAWASLPAWDGATALGEATAEMLARDEELTTFYLRYLENGRRGALDRARGVEETLRDEAVPAVEAELAELESDGLACAGASFNLDEP